MAEDRKKEKKKVKEKQESESLFEYYGFAKKDEREYPVVSGILNELTPKRIKREIEKIQAVELPVELLKWVEEYEKVGDRDRFLWKLIWEINGIIDPWGIHDKDLLVGKTLTAMLVVGIDDIAEKNFRIFL